MNLNGKKHTPDTRHALNISSGMTERIINNAKEKIGTLLISKENLKPKFEEKRKELDAAKAMYDEALKAYKDIELQSQFFTEEIKSQEIIISTMKGFKRMEGDKVLMSPATTKQVKGTKAPKRIAWLYEAADFLVKAKSFMTVENLVDALLKEPHIIELNKQSITWHKNPSSIRHSTIDSIIKHSQLTAKCLLKGNYDGTGAMFRPVLTVYKDKIGLVDWMEKDGNVVVPKDVTMLKEFMFNK